MTSTVIIAAHVPDAVEVQVTVYDGGGVLESITLQDGMTREFSVRDNRTVSVREVRKSGSLKPLDLG